MPTYSVLLQELVRLRRGSKSGLAVSHILEPGRSAVLGRKSAQVAPTLEAGIARKVCGEEGVLIASGDDQLLSLTSAQLAPLLAEPSESGSRVLLAVIYRLATIEQQLDDLGSYLRGGSAGRSFSAPTGVVQPVGGDEGKADVLEQVFRKNVSLREST